MPPFPPYSRLIAYLRDSGGDDQDLSLAQQEDAIRAWCAENNYTLENVYTDTRTGTTTVGRAGFERMLAYCRQRRRPNIAGLVIWRYSRFSRDIDDSQYYKSDLRRRGFAIYSMRDIIPDGIDGRFFESAYDWKSAKDIEILSDEVKRGQRHLLKNYGALGGVPPKGFMRDEITIGRRRDGRPHIVARWIPDPKLWETCRLAWKMRAGGASYLEINRVTNLFSSLNSYSTFFQNRIYLGELEFAGETIPDYAPPLIDLATWNAVQAINRTRTKNTGAENPAHPARSDSSYILSGLAYCAICGAPLNGNTLIFKTNGPRQYQYYGCSKQARSPDRCPARLIPKQALEHTILQNIIQYILSPENLSAIQNDLISEHQEHAAETIARRSELSQRISAIRHSINNIVNAIAIAGHNPSLIQKLNELETQNTNIQDEITQIDTWIQTPSEQLTPQQLLQHASGLRTILTTGNPDTQREIMRAFIERVTVERDGRIIRGLIRYYQPPHDLITNIPSGPDPPDDNVYVYVLNPCGGTKRRHKLFTLRFEASAKKHPT